MMRVAILNTYVQLTKTSLIRKYMSLTLFNHSSNDKSAALKNRTYIYMTFTTWNNFSNKIVKLRYEAVNHPV